MFEDAFGIARAERGELEVGARLVADRREIGEAEHAARLDDHVLVHLELFAQQRFGNPVAVLVEFEQHDMAAPAPLDCGAEIAHEVLGFFLDLDIAVAQHAENPVAQNLEAREQLVGKTRHQLFDRDIDRLFAGHAHEAWRAAGDQHHLDQIGLPLAALEAEDHPDPLVRDEGEGMARVDRLRRDQRQDVAFEIGGQPPLLLVGQGLDRCEDDAFLGKQRAQRVEAGLLAVFQLQQLLADRGELLARARPVDRLCLDPALDLTFQPGDADHGEFVEIAGRDRQEAQPFEQRIALVLAFGEHAAVERQPAQLAIGIAVLLRHRRIGFGVVGRQGRGSVDGHPGAATGHGPRM